MKQKEARALILREWERWLHSHSIDPAEATARDSLRFFIELQDRKSPLLDFASRGRDKWEIIHGWLLSQGRVVD